MDDDRDLEGQELDVTATPRKRRAARGVRVPNDPVPETKKAESSLLIVAEAPEDEFSDRPTQLLTEGTAPPAPRETKPAAVVTPVLDLTSLREAEHSKTALDDPPKSKPNIEILDELDASADSDAEVEFTDDATDSMDMPVIARPAVSGPPTGNGEEEQSVTIRQVRRR